MLSDIWDTWTDGGQLRCILRDDPNRPPASVMIGGKNLKVPDGAAGYARKSSMTPRSGLKGLVVVEFDLFPGSTHALAAERFEAVSSATIAAKSAEPAPAPKQIDYLSITRGICGGRP